MAYKLERADTKQATINLGAGTCKIGRGTFLKCSDKKVYEDIAELNVQKDSITLKKLRKEPCYIKAKGKRKATILDGESDTITLNEGDRFGLLPKTYWYRIVKCETPKPIEKQKKAVSNEPGKSKKSDSSTKDVLRPKLMKGPPCWCCGVGPLCHPSFKTPLRKPPVLGRRKKCHAHVLPPGAEPVTPVSGDMPKHQVVMTRAGVLFITAKMVTFNDDSYVVTAYDDKDYEYYY